MTRPAALFALVGLVATFHHVAASQAPSPAVCPRCSWAPPPTAKTIVVKNVGALQNATRSAAPNTTILLEDGEYRLESMLDISTPKVVLRGKSGDPKRVILRGAGMKEQRVGVAISISAPDVIVADLTAGLVANHGIQIRGERSASRVVLHNVHVIDTGQQLLKGSTGNDGRYAEDGLIACSRFEYTDHAPSNYTDGIDMLAARHWTVRDNHIARIRGVREENWSAGPAILFWWNSQDTVIERNVVVDSFRGIALGLRPLPANARGAPIDHQGGIVRNNVVWNTNAWADEGIEMNSAAGARVEHNTVFVEGTLDWSISLRFPLTTAVVQNNLTNRRVVLRTGGRGDVQDNVTSARREWFADPARFDFRINEAATARTGNAGVVDFGASRP